MVSKSNSTNMNLNHAQVFQGVYEDVSDYTEINVSVNTNINYVLTAYYSSNAINADSTQVITTTTPPTDTNYYSFSAKEKYFKLSFLNIDSNQSDYLLLQTIYKKEATNVNAILCDYTGKAYLPNSPLQVGGTVAISTSAGDQINSINGVIQTALNDGTGENAINSTSNALNTYLTNTSIFTSDTTAQASLTTLVSQTSTLAGTLDSILSQGTNIVGYLLGTSTTDTTCIDGDFSSNGNLLNSSIQVITCMASVSDVCVLTIQFSPDNTRWFDTNNIITFTSSGSASTTVIASIGYIRCRVNTTASTVDVTFVVNHV